ncbi:UNVERIFIED_CONTAM: hypothetical protein K2H54_060840 [Gekko kuhli]
MSTTFALEETLEADWVAVRPHAFHEPEKHKFVFIVAWNEIEGKFALTCHNRTAQRQRSGSREIRRGGSSTSSPGSSSPGGGAEQRPSSKAGGGSPPVRRSPAWSAEQGQARSSPVSPARAADSVLRSPGGRAAEGSQRSPARARSRPARRPQPGPEAPLSPATCAAEELEVLELGKDEPAGGAAAAAALLLSSSPPAEPSAGPCAEAEAPSGEECSWAGLFSFQDLRAVHQQLCSVNSELEPCLPVFPEEPSGMWTVLFGAPELSEQEMDALCYQLQVYLGHCLDTCGWKILSQVLFTETDDPEEYYESLSELRQKGYEEVLQRARKRIQEIWKLVPHWFNLDEMTITLISRFGGNHNYLA